MMLILENWSMLHLSKKDLLFRLLVSVIENNDSAFYISSKNHLCKS